MSVDLMCECLAVELLFWGFVGFLFLEKKNTLLRSYMQFWEGIDLG